MPGKKKLDESTQRLTNLIRHLDAIRKILAEEPGLHYVAGLEWDLHNHPEQLDYMDLKSPYYPVKQFEWRVYQQVFSRQFNQIDKSHRVLDLGSGFGRASIPLAKKGISVTAVDASPSALARLQKHAKEAKADRLIDTIPSHADSLPFEEATFDFVICLELLSYCQQPEQVAKEIRRVIKPGGATLISVESAYGALIADGSLTLADTVAILSHEPILKPGDAYIKYFTPEELRAMLLKAGFKPKKVFASHYTSSGPLERLAQPNDLSDKDLCRRLLDLEFLLSKHPLVKSLGRALCVSARAL